MKTRLLKGAVNVTFTLAIVAWVYLVAVVPVVQYTIDRVEVGLR